MKKLIFAVLMAFAAAGTSASKAQAQSEASGSIRKHEIGAGISGGDVVLANVRYGYNLNKNFRIETEASTGEVMFNGGGFLGVFSDDEVNYWISASGVARLPYGDNNSGVFIRAGAGLSEITAPGFTSQSPFYGPINTTYPDLTVNGAVVQAGIGVEHFFTKSFGLRVEAGYANDSAFDKISDTPGRSPREASYAVVGASAVLRF